MATFFETLAGAGLPVETADEEGRVIFSRSLSDAEDVIFNDMILKHFRPIEYTIKRRKENAKGKLALATQLKKVTPQQAVDYVDANVTNLASAKAVIKIMVRMIVALRDAQFPELPDE